MDSFLVARRPAAVLLPLTFGFAFFGLSLTPSFTSLCLLLSSLLFYTRRIESPAHRQAVFRTISAWMMLTVSITLSHLQASIHALSSVSTSVLSLALLSAISSTIGMIPILFHQHFLATGAPFVRLFSFPVTWTAVWLLFGRVSPIGRLITWTPLQGISSYEWLLPYFGFAGLDFITALWANVIAEGIERITPRQTPLVDLIPDISQTSKPPARKAIPLVSTIGCLLLLATPSFFISSLPLPAISSDTTTLEVACILPEPSTDTQFNRFMHETDIYVSRAKILLWPEGAVKFESKQDRESNLNKVQAAAKASKTFIGVSFEERLPADEGRRDGQYRNGLALVGPDRIEFTYYKRNLVPFTESFSQIASNEAPRIHDIEYHFPQEKNKKKKTRSISVTSSICLDFTTPFTSLSSRPALILAPAKTWHRSVGEAMYRIARARGLEVGAEVLWCDGGAGGLSGIAGDIQVGSGSWVKAIGVPYPSNERRTLYGFGGDTMAVAFLALFSGAIWVIHQRDLSFESLSRISFERIRLSAITDGVTNVRRRITNGLRRRTNSERQDRLIDIDGPTQSS